MINYELDGKVAVVTGGASGIGLACAHALARQVQQCACGTCRRSRWRALWPSWAVWPSHAYRDRRCVRLEPG